MVTRVFISYAREDVTLAGEVHRWLVAAGHEVFLDQDPRAGIMVGEQWRQRLHERLRWADAVVVVVTSAAVASGWCAAEIAAGQARGSRLIPLRAELGIDHPLLADIQRTQDIDLTQDRARARATLGAVLRQLDAAGGSGWPDDRSPFPGLRAFDVDQHRVFFGRTEEIKVLAELVRCTADRMVLLVGPSGCGKSSLVRAGLVPVMAAEPGWRVLTPISPRTDPVAALARQLAAVARWLGLEWTAEHVDQRLGADGLTPLASELLLADPDGPQRRLLVVVDQFEELLTQTAPAQRARFATLVRSALSDPAGRVRVVGAVRPEFLDPLLADPVLARLPLRCHSLRPLSREALRRVIEGPAELVGIEVEPHLVARLIEDTASGEALPLLAFTLAELADGVGRGGQLSATRYAQLGGVQGALARQADAALAEAVSQGGRSRAEVLAGLLRLVTVDEQGRPTRWRVHRDELPPAVVAELDAFVARRLLTTDAEHDTVVLSVAHEAFLSAWPPLAQAITASASALRARRAVEHAAAGWDSTGRSSERLWLGGQLAAAVVDTGARIGVGRTSRQARRGPAGWLPRRSRVLVTERIELSPRAREFLHASLRHDRARRRRATTVLSVLLILALAAASTAAVAQHRAQERQRIATAGQLAADAELVRGTDLREALLLGLAAHRLHPSGETHSSLVNTLAAGPYLATLTDHTSSVQALAFAPDGRILATGSADATVLLWDLTDPSQPQRLGRLPTGHAGAVNSVAVSSDGRTLATGSADHTVLLWDLTDPARPRRLGSPLTGHAGAISAVALTPDGHTLITGSDDQAVVLWDITDPAQPRRLEPSLTEHTGAVNSVAVSSDGRTLATGGDDHTVILWEVTDPAQPRLLGPPVSSGTEPIDHVAFAPGGRVLVASHRGGAVLWDLTDPARPHALGLPLHHRPPLTSTASLVFATAFAPDGRFLAVSGHNDSTVLWDLTDPAQPHPLGPPLGRKPPPTRSASRVNVVAFAPDGRTLATGSVDGTVILWDLTSPVQPQRLGPSLAGHRDWVWSVAFAPDGRVLATGSHDRTVQLWDVTDPAHPRQLGPPLSGHRNRVFSVAFSPDGRILATGSEDMTVILWDVSDPAQPRQLGPPLTGHRHSVWSLAFAPDRRTLATGSQDKTVILWDVTDPAQPRQLGPPLTGHTGSVLGASFTPDGRTLATGSVDATVLLWDVTNVARPRRLGSPLTGHTGAVRSIAVSPDGRTLATSSHDETTILWNVADPTQPHRLGSPLTSGILGVSSVAFAPDGRILATGHFDGTAILWDVTDPARPRRLGSPLASNTGTVSSLPIVLSVAFSPTGRTLVTGHTDSTATLWDLTSIPHLRDNVVQRACSITHGGLDRAEWDRYVPGLPYEHTCPVGG